MDGGATVGGAGLTAGGGGVVTQPATNAATSARNREAMGWILLEALVALVIAVAIVAWTMGPKRKRSRRDTGGDAGPEEGR
jgi:hypothetical protein